MDILKMVLALALIGCALAVATQFVVAPLYSGAGNAVLVVWYYLDILMAGSMIVTLAVQLQRKRAADRQRGDGLSRERLEANVMFFAALVVALWFFRNWFDFITSDPLGNQSVGTLIIWDILDPLLAILVGLTGLRLWRSSTPTSGYMSGGRA